MPEARAHATGAADACAEPRHAHQGSGASPAARADDSSYLAVTKHAGLELVAGMQNHLIAFGQASEHFGFGGIALPDLQAAQGRLAVILCEDLPDRT